MENISMYHLLEAGEGLIEWSLGKVTSQEYKN